MTDYISKDSESSGYTTDLSDEINHGSLPLPSGKFSDITPLYVSRSGATQLMTAVRYGKRFILKCLKEDFRYNPVYRTALSKEFDIGISLDHPNIRATVGFEEIEGLGPAIILEYVDGDTLESLIERGEITGQKGLSVLSQLQKALEYIHSKQIFHRDLKPSNIMVTHSGNVVKLIDFSLSDSNTFMVIKVPAGTRSYMDPEQLKPGAKADVKADIYSFGVIAGEIANLTGNRKLQKVANDCTAPNPASRPNAISEIDIPSAKSAAANGSGFGSKRMTAILVSIIILLSIWILAVGYNRFAKEDTSQEQTQTAETGSVRVLDSNYWHEKKTVPDADTVP